MKKILVLGIGPSQVDLIEKCKERGMKVYACAHNENGPGRDLVDEFRLIDIKDIDAIEEYARDKKVDYIFTMALESAIATMALVSERLNLPHFISSESNNLLNNKSNWRAHLGEIEGNLKFIAGSNISQFENWNTYPAIIKPVDSSGQRGVFPVNNKKELLETFEKSVKFSKQGTVIVEEMAIGPEISVNSFMHEGKLVFSVISDRISYDEFPGGIIKRHIVPSQVVDKEMEKKILKLVENVNRLTGFNNGHVYFQIKIQNRSPKLIEYTPRFDGCHMWRLIHAATGVDLREVALDWLDNGKINLPERYNVKGDFALCFISDKPNTIVKYDNYIFENEPIFNQWYYTEGEVVRTVTGFLEKVGYYITNL